MSSNVTSITFDKETSNLRVEFHGGGRPGRVYDYPESDSKLYRSLKSAKSKGKAVWNKLRRPGKNFQKAS